MYTRAQVATLCSVLDRDLADKTKTTEVDIGPLLTTSYASLFNQEVVRRIKQVGKCSDQMHIRPLKLSAIDTVHALVCFNAHTCIVVAGADCILRASAHRLVQW
jgi:hypothetical protein